MTRRASLPGIDELFRSSKDRAEEPERSEAVSLQIAKETVSPSEMVDAARSLQEPALEPGQPGPEPGPEPALEPVPAPALQGPETEPRLSEGAPVGGSESGRRPRHDEKVTFYCTASDLTRIERARLALRAEHKLASDRGRIVRAALAEILDDFEAHGPTSALVRRLRQDRTP
jgi:hypothetical protein